MYVNVVAVVVKYHVIEPVGPCAMYMRQAKHSVTPSRPQVAEVAVHKSSRPQ